MGHSIEPRPLELLGGQGRGEGERGALGSWQGARGRGRRDLRRDACCLVCRPQATQALVGRRRAHRWAIQ